ncbi:MAG: hypothetical protein QG560_312 [Campylobacterota bacterium]|nr:hypothetical protein [Campylobacterota bacterium]MDQ1338107.1 hypothetical protein [Campylobacterota bacterium]
MIKKLRTELIYFFVILLFLAVIQHSDLLTSPIERLNRMVEAQNYIHPVLWAFSVYALLGIIRLLLNYILYLKNKRKK